MTPPADQNSPGQAGQAEPKAAPLDNRRMVRLTIVSALIQALFYLRTLILLPIMTHWLGVELYGVWSKLTALINLAAPALDGGAGAGMRRFLPAAAKSERGPIIGTALALVLLGGGLVSGLSLFFHKSLSGFIAAGLVPGLIPAVALSGLTAALMVFFTRTTQYYRCTDRPIRLALATGIMVGLMAALSLAGWALMDRNLLFPVIVFMVAYGAVAIWLIGAIAREAGLKVRLDLALKMLRFGLPLLPNVILLWVINFADRYMLAWLTPQGGDALVGVYTANYAVGGLVVMAFSPFMLFCQPTVARLWDGNRRPEALRLLAQTLKFGLLAALPLLIAAPFGGRELLALIAGNDFVAQPLILVLIITGFLLLKGGNVIEIGLVMEQRTVRIMFHNILVAGLNITLNLILIPFAEPWGGITGAALATVLSYAAYALLTRFSLVRMRGLVDHWAILKSLAAAGAAGAIVALIGTGSIPSALAAAFSGLIVFGGLVLALRVVTFSEIKTVAQAVGSGRR